MRVCYHIQSHRSVPELARLVQRLRADSPDSVIVVSHHASQMTPELSSLRSEQVFVLLSTGGYGDFSHVARYLEAVELIRHRGLDVDWVINVSGQDYPVVHLAQIEPELNATAADALIESWPLHSPEAHWTARNISTRYEYRHHRVAALAGRGRWVMPLRAVNAIQPWIRLNTHYGSIGVRRRPPFDENLVLHGGSFFGNLSWRAVECVLDFVRREPAVVEWFRHVLAPEEIFFQTVLENSPGIVLERDCRRYFDFSRTRENHPAVLQGDDLDAVVSSGAWFARKVELGSSDLLVAELDERARNYVV
jgi:Core-2/I-Branching enzyme